MRVRPAKRLPRAGGKEKGVRGMSREAARMYCAQRSVLKSSPAEPVVRSAVLAAELKILFSLAGAMKARRRELAQGRPPGAKGP